MKIGIKGILAGVILGTVLSVSTPYLSADDYQITVQEKQPYENGIYKVWSDDGQVFVIEDSLSYLNFSSSNIYGKMKIDHTYNITASGWRFGMFSMFENIVSVKEVK